MNRQVQLLSRPNGIPQAENFRVVDAPMPELHDGQVLVRNIYLSVEPAMRGWVSAAANYSEPVAIGGVMRSFAVGRVVASKHPDYAPGEYVTGLFGWQDHAAVDAATIQRKVPSGGAPISTALGVLGINGLTAYFALLDIGQPKAGETVVVSTAAGAVGSCVGQIANIHGCRTVGITGGPDKVKLCRDAFGYEVAIDYRSGDLDAQLAALGGRLLVRHGQASAEVDGYEGLRSLEILIAAYRSARDGQRVGLPLIFCPDDCTFVSARRFDCGAAALDLERERWPPEPLPVWPPELLPA